MFTQISGFESGQNMKTKCGKVVRVKSENSSGCCFMGLIGPFLIPPVSAT